MVVDEESNSDYVTFTGILENYKEVIRTQANVSSSQNKARTINPEVSVNDYDFYLFGQADYGNTDNVIGPYPITMLTGTDTKPDSVTQGVFKCTLPKGLWYLTLTAFKSESNGGTKPVKGDLKYFYTNDETKNRPLLTGMAVCDVSKANTSKPKFLLSPEGLTTKGNVNLQIELEGWTFSDHSGITGDDLEHVVSKAQIRKHTANNDGAIVTESNLSFAKNGTIDKAAFAASDLTPGTYDFSVIFYEPGTYTDNDGNEVTYTKRNWLWSDNLTVYPGRATDTTIYIPRMINEAPESPENFLLSHYATDNENFVSKDGLYYTCIFQWTDKSNTESGFEIRLTDIDDLTTTVYTKDILANKNLYIAGNLGSSSGNSNTRTLEARVRLGHKIKAEIRSVCGDIGSDWVEGKLANLTQAPSNGVTFTHLTSTQTDPAYNAMNMYKVTYNFNGGKNSEAISLNNIGNVAINALQDTYTFYGPNSSLTQITITTDTDKKKIYRSTNSETKYFNFWGLTPVSASEYTENPFASTNYQNIDIWAQYKELDQSDQQTQQQQQEKLEKRLQTYIKIANSSISDDAFTKDSSLKLTLGNTTKVELTNNVNRFTTWDSDTFKYEYMSISIKDENGITLFTGYATNVDTTTIFNIVTASKITINIPVTTENGFEASNTKIYTMQIQARPEKSTEIIPTTIYFKVTN